MNKKNRKIELVPYDQEDNGVDYWLSKTPEERMRGLYIINRNAFLFAGYDYTQRLKKVISTEPYPSFDK